MPDANARRATLTVVPNQCHTFGSPPWIGAFLRLVDGGFDVEVALELAAADYDVLGVADLSRLITGGAA